MVNLKTRFKEKRIMHNCCITLRRSVMKCPGFNLMRGWATAPSRETFAKATILEAFSETFQKNACGWHLEKISKELLVQ